MAKKMQRESRHGKVLRAVSKNLILIVEDEKLVAWDIEQTLRDHDFQEIIVATSIRGARELVQSVAGQVSLAILDLKLDDGDAAVLIDEFTLANIAVLVVTGYTDFKHAHVPVLIKPFSTSALLHAIHSLLDIR